jgi:hypothetical protein
MGTLNKATKEQAKLMGELRRLGNDCPPPLDKEAFNAYQIEVMQPIRDLIIAVAK